MSPRPRRHGNREEAAELLSRVAPLASRWVERLLNAHEPPLSLAQYAALTAVADGELVGAELARRAAVSPAAVSQLLGSLEREGLLERTAAADDRRRQVLALGPEGRRVLRSARTLLRSRLAELLGDVPPHEADALVGLLEELEARLSGTAPPRRPKRPRPPPPDRKHGRKR
jgi:DNA-binding MarR family transcriptional regulator